MQIVIELSEAQVEAIESFLTTQVDPVQNPISGNNFMRAKYKGVEDFVLSQTAMYVANAMQMYPPASVQADMQAIKAAQERIAELAKPTIAEAKRP